MPPLYEAVLVKRDTTERPEVGIVGTAKLFGTDVNKIFDEVARPLDQ